MMATSRSVDNAFPLKGRVVLITRPAPQCDLLAEKLKAEGAVPLVIPAIMIAPAPDEKRLTKAREHLSAYDFAMFVSANAAHYALSRGNVSWSPKVTALATGEGTRAALIEAGVPAACIQMPETRQDSEGLLALPILSNVSGKRVVIFRGEEGRAVLGETLRARGATVDYVVAYQRLPPAPLSADLRQTLLAAKLSAVTLTATEALLNLETMLDHEALTYVKRAIAFVPHPRIAAAAEKLGWKTVETSSGDSGLIEGIRRYFVQNQHGKEGVANMTTHSSELDLVTEEKGAEKNTSPHKQESPSQEAPPPKKANAAETLADAPESAAPKHRPRALSVIIALLLTVGLGLMGWQNYHLKTLQDHETKRLDEVEKLANRFDSEDVARTATFGDWTEKIGSFAKSVKAMQDESEISKRYYSQRPMVGDDVLMYEIEYRVRFAEQQLMVGNAEIALSMLKKAEEDLAALNRLDVGNIRAKLNQSVAALQAMPPFDASAYMKRIDEALASINQLAPLTIPTEMPPVDVDREEVGTTARAGAWARFTKSLRETLLSVVRVHVGSPTGKGNSLGDIELDRQELRLRLLSLRLMVLTRNGGARAESIALSGWLNERFDEKNESVAAIRKLLEDLAESAIVAPLPDLFPTLSALNTWRAARR